MQQDIVPVNVQFLGNGQEIYGPDGLKPETVRAVGIDLRACLEDAEMVILPGERGVVRSGIAIAPQKNGIAGFVYSRSGLGAMKGIVVAQGTGVIDPDYRGEIKVVLLNTSKEAYTVSRGERIAQLVFQPCFQARFAVVERLDETGRGSGGFGHTGKQ